MYKILTKASISQITVFHRCASIWGKLTSSATAPNSSMRKWDVFKCGFLQLVCCWRERHFEDNMLPPSRICCSDKNYSSLTKNQLIFLLLQGFTKLQISTYHLLRIYAHTLLDNYLYIPCVPSLSTMRD